MDRDDNAAVNVLNAGLKRIFSTFIMGRNHKKREYPRTVGNLCPWRNWPIPFGKPVPWKREAPCVSLGRKSLK